MRIHDPHCLPFGCNFIIISHYTPSQRCNCTYPLKKQRARQFPLYFKRLPHVYHYNRRHNRPRMAERLAGARKSIQAHIQEFRKSWPLRAVVTHTEVCKTPVWSPVLEYAYSHPRPASCAAVPALDTDPWNVTHSNESAKYNFGRKIDITNPQ